MDLSQPRFSANELGNFVFASEAAKKRMVHSQKFPQAIKVARYTSASSAILRAFKDGIFSSQQIEEEIAQAYGKACFHEISGSGSGCEYSRLEKVSPDLREGGACSR